MVKLSLSQQSLELSSDRLQRILLRHGVPVRTAQMAHQNHGLRPVVQAVLDAWHRRLDPENSWDQQPVVSLWFTLVNIWIEMKKELTSGCWWCVCPSWERWSRLWNRTVTVITLFWHISCCLLCIYMNNRKCFNQVFQLTPFRKSSCSASKSSIKLEAWGQTRPAKAF